MTIAYNNIPAGFSNSAAFIAERLLDEHKGIKYFLQGSAQLSVAQEKMAHGMPLLNLGRVPSASKLALEQKALAGSGSICNNPDLRLLLSYPNIDDKDKDALEMIFRSFDSKGELSKQELTTILGVLEKIAGVESKPASSKAA